MKKRFYTERGFVSTQTAAETQQYRQNLTGKTLIQIMSCRRSVTQNTYVLFILHLATEMLDFCESFSSPHYIPLCVPLNIEIMCHYVEITECL